MSKEGIFFYFFLHIIVSLLVFLRNFFTFEIIYLFRTIDSMCVALKLAWQQP